MLLLVVFGFNARAQKFDFISKINIGIGANYNSIDYDGGDVFYSPGGGMGIELGLGYHATENLVPYLTLGYQQNIAIQYISSNGESLESSVFFNRTSFFAGANYDYMPWKSALKGIRFGGGINYNFPGKMKITENNSTYSDLSYDSSLGYNADVAFIVAIKSIKLLPGIRYRNMSFSASNSADRYLLPSHLKTLNGSGVDLTISFVKSF
ncbi:hypothetical protein [Solitalea longa]|nr:hypothetical protein [Solitalea longa]